MPADPQTTDPDLCEDEGCPNVGTPHVCISPQTAAYEAPTEPAMFTACEDCRRYTAVWTGEYDPTKCRWCGSLRVLAWDGVL